MAKVLSEAQITTANARGKLPIGPHWRAIDPATHLGYRRGKRGGRWLVRWYQGDGTYRQETIGIADDSLTADGEHTLSFAQAVSRARGIVEDRRTEDAARKAGPPLTVRAALEDYIAERNERERKTASVGLPTSEADNGHRRGTYVRRDAESRLRKHVLSNVRLSDRLLAMLEAALDVIGVLKTSDRNQQSPYLLPGRSKGKPLNNLSKSWHRVCQRAEITGARLHDLRHTAASIAVGRGGTLPIIGRLLGHRQPQTTQRYAHVDADPALAIANQIGEAMAGALGVGGRPRKASVDD